MLLYHLFIQYAYLEGYNAAQIPTNAAYVKDQAEALHDP